MKMEVTPQTREAINRVRDMVHDIAEQERHNLEAALREDISRGDTKMNLEDHHVACDHLRYVIFQDVLADAFKSLSMACHIIDQSDEELSKMCAESGETVQSAFRNAMSNMMMEVLSRMLENTPPPM